MAADNITLIIPSAVAGGLLTVAGNFALRLFTGKPAKPKTAPCEGCPFHADHEKRILALELHRARMEEALPAIRDALHSMQDTLKTILLRLGGAQQ